MYYTYRVLLMDVSLFDHYVNHVDYVHILYNSYTRLLLHIIGRIVKFPIKCNREKKKFCTIDLTDDLGTRSICLGASDEWLFFNTRFPFSLHIKSKIQSCTKAVAWKFFRVFPHFDYEKTVLSVASTDEGCVRGCGVKRALFLFNFEIFMLTE